ncbi:MAG: o-succinylbenzoate synthase [Propionibacteriaceae bacterium]
MPVTLPPLDEVLASAHVVSLAMRVRFRRVLVREALLLDGPYGWGEFSPFVEYDDDEAAAWLASGIEAAWHGWPAARRELVDVNATVPAVPAEQVPAILDRFGDCRTVKVKVAEPGQSLADDVARVRAVRTARPDAAIRVDANGAWTVAQATTALRSLAEVGLQYAEQPCAAVDDLVALRERLDRDHIDVVIAADESVRKADDPVRVARTGAVGVAVVKVAPLGGVARTLDVAADLAALGVRVVVSSALDTSVGIAAGVAAAGALPETPLACGLGTVALFEADVCAQPLMPVAGTLPVRTTAPVPDPAGFPAAPDRTQWWLDRLARCWGVLDARRAA